MDKAVRRVFIEKRAGYDIEAQGLFRDIKYNLGIKDLTRVRIINRYDIQGITEEDYLRARNIVFAELPVDIAYDEQFTPDEGDRLFALEYLPGQYDQRADSAAQCVQILTGGEKPVIRAAKLIEISGKITDCQFEFIRNYCINPVESREASLEKPESLDSDMKIPTCVPTIEGFILLSKGELQQLKEKMGFAMTIEDLDFCRKYFKFTEQRDPTVTELRVLDTYWSDHCRHTTFLTGIEKIEFEDGKYNEPVKQAYEEYIAARKFVYRDKYRDITLMDIATIAMKEFRKRGLLEDLEESDEINACSIRVDVDVDGKTEEWLVMFKNETHNHPTEIEPFGGAATCLGGAIRDPLSGRSYVYQAMRVTGSGDPRARFEDTLPGKLPQRKITYGAAQGFSSYGNQIGLSTGQVEEIYDPGYIAKRMEIGAVIGAAPSKNVIRKKPEAGDIIVLLGGRTGRDGCGGATGSSREHNEESLLSCGAEVQKGNPVTERKIQRLFRKPEVSAIIKKCNDFGAGGVAVAIGELADGLVINLNAVPKKYEGLDGTELAISESQERMAVLLDKKDAGFFIEQAATENAEATPVAVVTDDKRLVMTWNGVKIVDISREFLNTNGVRQTTDIRVKSPDSKSVFFSTPGSYNYESSIRDNWLENLSDLSNCSRKGLAERFDSSIGAGTILMPFGGRYQLSPSEGMAAKLPVIGCKTKTATLMAFGYNPKIAKWSPFHGAVYAVTEAAAKIAAMGGDYKRIRLTLQEYFEKLREDPERWGKPFSALLGAYYAQTRLGIPSIGGKDSMSGSFLDLDVPPTLVAFAVAVSDASKVISSEFKKPDRNVVMLEAGYDDKGLPQFENLKVMLENIHQLSLQGKILSCSSIRSGGAAAAVSRMCFGNMIGFKFEPDIDAANLFRHSYGSVIIELSEDSDIKSIEDTLKNTTYRLLGRTSQSREIEINGEKIKLEDALEAWMQPLEKVFPTQTGGGIHKNNIIRNINPAAVKFPAARSASVRFAKPRIFLPVFPGTNCEYDTEKEFVKAGGLVDVMVIRNMTASDIECSISEIVRKISKSQIIMFPGGFSAGDEPDGSGKFIAAVFRNKYISEAIMKLLKERDGLMLGICNGFQALIKLGLLPYGEMRELSEDSPTLTYNTLGRHVSCMVSTKVVSKLSPWLNETKLGDIHTIPVSHGEGRFVAGTDDIRIMAEKGQIATQYVDLSGNPTYDIRYNINGSLEAIEGITSPDGRIFGKMAHSERISENSAINVPGNKDQHLFVSGVKYFS